MALPIPSSTSSLHLEADHASSSFTFIPSDSDFEDLNHPHSVSHTNSDLGKAFIDFNIEDDTDKNQRYHQQKQQRKTWAPSSLSLKPLRAKPTGRNSLPTVSARKTKTLSNSTISRFVSSLASVAVASSSRLDPTVEETNQLLPGSSPSYRLSSFFFETTTIPISSVKTNTSSPSSSSTTSIDSSTLTSSCTPSATNSTNNKNISTSSISAPTTTTCPGSLSSSPNHQVGQLLFGAPILDDPAFFEKEFHAIINDHQLYRHPVSILHPKQNTHWDDDDDKQQQQQRIDDGFLLLKTMNLQQLYTDCQHVGESTTQWMQDQDKECQDDQVSQLTLEWGYINCHRILEQYNRLLAPETHSGSSDDKKALYSSIRQQLDTMEDDIADEHTMAGLENLVQSLANAIYQGILLTNYGRTVIPNKDYWIEGSNHHHPPSSSSTTTTITSYNTVDHRDEKTTWYPELFAGICVSIDPPWVQTYDFYLWTTAIATSTTTTTRDIKKTIPAAYK
ncbi:hypothetical protein BC941DRAFT_227331 [Chlamydoabsidia padenii]|nr:hypothetical protein BC941DRAFT_227331 [Chlamydoabsidia padenii]